MTDVTQLGDLDLAALVSSKVCHDAIGPMTAIGFGLDILDEDDDEESRDNALGMIRDGIGKITVKLQFARLAFGAAGSSGFEIDLFETEKVARGYVESEKKHKLDWQTSIDQLPKNYVKLLLNLVAIAMGTVPRGGSINVEVSGDKQHPVFTIRTEGKNARVPAGILDLLNGTPEEEVDARSIQPYFAGRVARSAGLDISMEMEGDGVIIKAVG
jgi:histidine phosphotransferase ChpT